MQPISAALLVKALDCLSARAVVTAENIANAGTQGYRPFRVTFEQVLARAGERGADAVAAVSPQVARTTDKALGGQMRLDLELATASATSARYAALLDVLGREMQIAALAGGRGQ